ncbi:MAG: OmpA family protein [Anaeromyxobacter sp.]
MRRISLLAVAVAALAVTGCPKKPEKGECQSSADCASQEGYGKVCVQGRCQECAADADCKAGFVCRTNKCVPKPQCGADADCAEGQMCQGERCVTNPDYKKPEDNASKVGAVPPECADAGAFTIRFGFDQSAITAQSQDSLQKLADCLKRAPAKKVTVSGHADERGTTQYNVALGSRRAEAAKKYLSDLGVSAAIETVSYGEEKPLCKQATEDCWAENRRDEFQVER